MNRQGETGRSARPPRGQPTLEGKITIRDRSEAQSKLGEAERPLPIRQKGRESSGQGAEENEELTRG